MYGGSEHTCPVCGKKFIAPENVLYCSRRCRKKAYRQRYAQRGKKNYAPRKCVICGQTFYPRTDNQHTCGGTCTISYMQRRYGRYLNKKKTVKKDDMPTKYYVEISKEFLDSLQPAAGHNERRYELAQLAAIAARELDRTLPFWRNLKIHRQEALLNLAVGMGCQKLLGRRDIYMAIMQMDWSRFKSLILSSAWAGLNGKRAVMMCRQLEADEYQF